MGVEWSVGSKPGRFPSAAPEKQVLVEDESGDPGREAEQRDPIKAQCPGHVGLKWPQPQEEIRHEQGCKGN